MPFDYMLLRASDLINNQALMFIMIFQF